MEDHEGVGGGIEMDPETETGEAGVMVEEDAEPEAEEDEVDDEAEGCEPVETALRCCCCVRVKRCLGLDERSLLLCQRSEQSSSGSPEWQSHTLQAWQYHCVSFRLLLSMHMAHLPRFHFPCWFLIFKG